MQSFRHAARGGITSGTILIVLVALISALFPAKSAAGINTWTTHGPEGGWVSSLVIDDRTPATVYAGTRGGGIFKTSNGGGNWMAVNTGLSSIVSALGPGRMGKVYQARNAPRADSRDPCRRTLIIG